MPFGLPAPEELFNHKVRWGTGHRAPIRLLSTRRFDLNWHSNRGKSGLIKMLMKDHKLSKRKAEKVVNAVFELMTRALWRGEVVELPIGWIKAAAPSPRRRKAAFQKFRNIQTGRIFNAIARYPKRNIRFTPNKQPFLPIEPPDDPELIRKGNEMEQLFMELMGREMTLPDCKGLMEAADHKLDRLLARLRQIRKDGLPVAHALQLQSTVRQLYWIR